MRGSIKKALMRALILLIVHCTSIPKVREFQNEICAARYYSMLNVYQEGSSIQSFFTHTTFTFALFIITNIGYPLTGLVIFSYLYEKELHAHHKSWREAQCE